MDVDDLQVLRAHMAHHRYLVAFGGGEPRRSEYTGIKGLMLAVLEDGMASYLGRAGHRRNEAEAWVMAAPGRAPFSFTVVCETLGLEPDAVRLALAQRARKPARRAFRRLRPNVRHRRQLAAG